MSTELPSAVRAMLAQHQQGGVAATECKRCSSPCCLQGGFALLENVEAIYDRYREGGLKRDDYRFPPGLSFTEFALTYFDVTVRTTGRGKSKRQLLLFHMRSLSAEGQLIAIPAVGDYYEVRCQLFDDNRWLNRGCVFLSKRTPVWPDDDQDGERHCILHQEDATEHLGLKPIDCVFLTCDTPKEIRYPSATESDHWFSTLARAFPGSVERFRAMMGG